MRSDTARLMLANSEFLILLNQSATDREELASLLNISDTQLGYISQTSLRAAALSAVPGPLYPLKTHSPGALSFTAL